MLDRISRFSYIKYLSTLNFTQSGACESESERRLIGWHKSRLLLSYYDFLCFHSFSSFLFIWWLLELISPLFWGHFLHLHFYFAYWQILSQIKCFVHVFCLDTIFADFNMSIFLLWKVFVSVVVVFCFVVLWIRKVYPIISKEIYQPSLYTVHGVFNVITVISYILFRCVEFFSCVSTKADDDVLSFRWIEFSNDLFLLVVKVVTKWNERVFHTL